MQAHAADSGLCVAEVLLQNCLKCPGRQAQAGFVYTNVVGKLAPRDNPTTSTWMGIVPHHMHRIPVAIFKDSALLKYGVLKRFLATVWITKLYGSNAHLLYMRQQIRNVI